MASEFQIQSHSYVMVPVPEELIHDVVMLVQRLNLQRGATGSLKEWDDAAIEKYFLEADEETRSLLSVVARASLAGKSITDQMAADFVQLGMRETFEILRTMKISLSNARRPQLVTIENAEEALPSGRLRTRRVLRMEQDLARLVRSAERAEQDLEPHPLERRG